MVKVENKRNIKSLARSCMRASKSRNIVAVGAIALTTILFTVLFTVVLSINHAVQESNFRQIGGRAHGSYRYVTKEQVDELKEDSMIKEYGTRHILGVAEGELFSKTSVEISYCDENYAEWSFCTPTEGRFPTEGTKEAATDTEVLHMLGVVPEIGVEFTLPMEVGGNQTERTFTLCGWWESDAVAPAHHVLVPDSTVEDVLGCMGIAETGGAGVCGSWMLNVMLSSTFHVEEDLLRILGNHGYHYDEISTGVNWGYTASALAINLNTETIVTLAPILLLMMGTGYLIIYNVFQISVVGDIRFFGLLKTIGTTRKQIKCILRTQALLLSAIGIPMGLFFGWLVGAKLTPLILGEMNVGMEKAVLHPFIFLFATVFALVTVLISCHRPGRIAAAISPVEAIRYTEGNTNRKKIKKGKGSSSLFSMAKDNLTRSKSKTVITIVSMALSVVLLNLTIVFTKGLDMEKYVSEFINGDFLIADAAYFRCKKFCAEQVVSQEVVDILSLQAGVEEYARVFGIRDGEAYAYMEEEEYVSVHSSFYSPEGLEELLGYVPRGNDGRIISYAQPLGMEPAALQYVEIIEGDIERLNDPGGYYIAAIEGPMRWAGVGDTVTVGYGDRIFDYEVVAVVSVPHSLGYRYSGDSYFLIHPDTLYSHSGTADILCAMFNVEEEAEEEMERFLSAYTGQEEIGYDYESKFTLRQEFEGLRRMFLVVGSVLSFIVGMIGVLNFSNAILTGILARKREFAMLQSIGMTGRQLKRMLVFEGMMYAGGAAVIASIVNLLVGFLAKKGLANLLWFFTYQPTMISVVVLIPLFVILGVGVPMVMYRMVAKQTIVERLREAES